MNNYESIIIFRSSLDDTALRAEVGKVLETIEKFEGEPVTVENWGKRELGYKMKKEKFGIYTNFRFNSKNSEIVEELQRTLRIADGVLKFQTYRLSDKKRRYKGLPDYMRKALSEEEEVRDSSDR